MIVKEINNFPYAFSLVSVFRVSFNLPMCVPGWVGEIQSVFVLVHYLLGS